MVNETRKILKDELIGITATCVRVPVTIGHSEAVNVEFHKPLSADRAREILSSAPGIEVVDDPIASVYPLAADAAGRDACRGLALRRLGIRLDTGGGDDGGCRAGDDPPHPHPHGR